MTTDTDTTAPTATAPPPPRRGPASGTIFVLVCALLAIGFVVFLVVVSPVLLERTLALAPDPAPQVVATGELDGRTWTVTALDGTADERGVDSRGIERVVEPEPCVVVDLADGTAPTERCVLRRGGSIRALDVVRDDSGRNLVVGIVAPEVASVTLTVVDGTDLEVTPIYVDFGFPLGFVVADLDGTTTISGARAVDRDDVERATATCTGTAPFATCIATEGDY